MSPPTKAAKLDSSVHLFRKQLTDNCILSEDIIEIRPTSTIKKDNQSHLTWWVETTYFLILQSHADASYGLRSQTPMEVLSAMTHQLHR